MQRSRIFGAANGGVWWQINAQLIGSGNVLIRIIRSTDGSWIKKGLPCEALYVEVFIRICCWSFSLLIFFTYMNECHSNYFEYKREQAIQEGRVSFLGSPSSL